MLILDNHITINRKTIDSANLCEAFSSEDLDKIGQRVHETYIRDRDSRKDWLRRTEAAMDLAMQVQQDKNFPWPGCSNIAFPLITIAALQFHARAYPAIVNGRNVVATRVVGPDPHGLAKARAERISAHMSWQLLEQSDSWEEETDRSLLNVSIVGCGFKKTYWGESVGHPVSDFVQAKDLVVNYWAKSIEGETPKTHVFPLFRNEIRERVLRGTFSDCLNETWYQGIANPQSENRGPDNRAGVTRPEDDEDTPFTILEQHCWFDLDGDGYKEPYIITVEESSQFVLRIVARFNREEDVERTSRGQIIRINPMEFFTKIPFVPSPDGSLLDVGFGTLIGPLNESVNSSINQLFDAGTLSNTSGGFLGRGAKIRGGTYQFQPFSWNRVDASGDDLRKSIFPLPVREPSGVMFNLLGLLIDYTNRITGATDMLVGENPGQNTPAETARTLTEQGQKIYSAIFKRIWRSLKYEFKKVYILNSLYLPATMPFGDAGEIRREDYAVSAVSVIPVADPTIASEGQRYAQARLLREAAATSPGYDADAVERTYLKALGFDNIDQLYPGAAEPAPDVKLQIEQMRGQIKMAELEQQKSEFIMTMQETVRLNNAKILQLMAQAEKMEKEASTIPAKQNVEAFRAGIEAIREQNKASEAQLDRMMESMKNERETRTTNTGAGILPSLEATPGNEAPLPMAGESAGRI